MHSAIRANQTAHHIITGRIVHLTHFWLISLVWYVCTNRLCEVPNLFFDAPRTCCWWWPFLEVNNLRKPYTPAGLYVRFIYTVHRRETAEKQRFRSCPEKKRENRTKPRFCTVYSYGAPWWKNGVLRFSLRRVENRTVEKNVQRGTTPNHTVGFTTSENRTEPHRRIYHSTEPHRRISYFSYLNEPHRRISFFQNRTEPHRRNAIEAVSHRVRRRTMPKTVISVF